MAEKLRTAEHFDYNAVEAGRRAVVGNMYKVLNPLNAVGVGAATLAGGTLKAIWSAGTAFRNALRS